MRASPHLRRGLAAVLAAGALVAAGCGEKTVDTGEAEEEISDKVFERTKVRVDVSCPDDMKAKKGETYRCELEEDGEKLGVLITMTDDDGGFKSEQLLSAADAEKKISDSLFEQRKVRVDVSCPDDMKATQGETYRCELEEDGRKLGVTITMTDGAGGFRYKVDEN